MTLERALQVAQDEAAIAGQARVIYRLPGWPVGVYDTWSGERLLPLEAEIAARIDPDGSTRTPDAPADGRLF
jgi:hypothetical protein